jgi:CBS domain-containing protein
MRFEENVDHWPRHDPCHLSCMMEAVAEGTRVDDLMSQRPVFITEGEEAYRAGNFAKTKGVHYLLVVDGENDLTAVTCQCDLERAKVRERVANFAHSPVTYVMSGERADRAAEIMRRCGVGCLPVLRDPGEVVGVLTRRDLGNAGLWNWEWGVTLCASCGGAHGLEKKGEGVVFCRDCLESTPEPGTLRRRWYCAIGYGG